MADVLTIDEAAAYLKLPDTGDYDDALVQFVAGVSAHVARQYGTFPSDSYTESLPVIDDGQGLNRLWLRPVHAPVLTVTSATDEYGTAYTDGFTISPDGYAIRHDLVTSGEWTVVYTAGETAVPDDLKLAALEDVRGLWQPAQIGAPAQFGAFGIDSTDTGPTYRPVRMWPRVDAWIEANQLPGIA